MRLNLPAVGLLTPVLLGACATHHETSAPPAGLVYDCRSTAGTGTAEVMIQFNGQGYQPGNVAMTSAGEAPRSTATLWYGGQEHRLMADWTYLGMRYHSTAPMADGQFLVWTADGEEARILAAAASGSETELASCTRKRSVEGSVHSGHDATHRR